MAKKLRKTLHKDIKEHMDVAFETGDYSVVHDLFEKCVPDARESGFSKYTALMFGQCTPELAAWLIARGADVNATDTWGRSALFKAAYARFHHRLSAADLLKLGADLHLRDNSENTALHFAVDGKNLESVRVLLEAGAEINAKNEDGLTPLGYAVLRLSNIGLEPMVPVAQALLDAGAAVSPSEQDNITRTAENFEFHRSGFNKDSVEATANAAMTLCELFGVAYPKQRVMHDGQAQIIIPQGSPEEVYAALWDFLVPSSGACETVQGEVVRIPGRIRDELMRNGGANWDKDYNAMTVALRQYLRLGTPLDALALSDVKALTTGIRQNPDQIERLIELALQWVEHNPAPIVLPKPTYSR